MDNKKINLGFMFTAGIILVIISGLTFVTTNWSVMTGLEKTGVMCFMTVFFYIGALLGERLKLEKTGNTLYILGCFFATLTVLGCGWFQLFGEWFSMTGNGRMFFYGAVACVLLVTTLIGALKYNHRPYGFIMWSSLTIFVCCMLFGLKNYINEDFVNIVLGLYSLLMVFMQKAMHKIKNDALRKPYHIFVMMNTVVLGAFALFNAKDFLTMCMFTVSWLKISVNEKEDVVGGMLSGLFMFMTMWWLVSPNSASKYALTFAAFVSAMTFVSVGNLVNKIVSTVFRGLSIGCMAITLVLCFGNLIDGWNLPSQLGIFILMLNNLILIYRGNRLMKYVQPFISSVFFVGIVYLLKDYFYIEDECACLIVIVLQIINFLLTLKYSQIRSSVSDIVIGLSLIVPSCYIAINGFTGYVGLAAFIGITIYLLIENKYKISKMFFSYTLPYVMFMIVYFNGYFAFRQNTGTIFLSLLTFMTGLVLFVKDKRFYPLELSMLIATVISTLFIGLNEYRILFTVLFTALWVFKVYKSRESSELVSTLVAVLELYLCVVFVYDDYGDASIKNIFLSVVPFLTMLLSFLLPKLERKLTIGAEAAAYLSIFIMLVLIEKSNNFNIVTGCLLSVFTYGFVCCRKNNTFAVLPIIYLYSAVANRAIGLDDKFMIAILYIFSIGMNVIGSITKKYQKVEYTEIFGIIHVLMLLSRCNDMFFGFLLGAILLALTAVSRKVTFEKKAMLTGSAFLLVLALLSQKIMAIPQIINAEFNAAIVMSFVISLKYIWGRNETISMVIYFMGILCIFCLFVDGVETGLVADGIILGSIGFVIMLLGFVLKKKKWFMLGMITLVFISIYMTKAFWLSLGWWAYLLIVGIILIAIAGISEWKKRKE